MILYFTGTGNSAYVAKEIANELQEEPINLLERIQKQEVTALYSDTPWVIVTPTYAWRIPRILEDWLSRVELKGNRDLYFVMTCGGSIGNADAYNRKLCTHKGMKDKGTFSILMPENYIAMYSAPDQEEAVRIIDDARSSIMKAIQIIKTNASFPSTSVTIKDKVSSGIVNDIFYPIFVHAKKFYVKDTCISCGKCEAVCPLNNIRLVDGKPHWEDHCTHCMACICKCPVSAIEYGKSSAGKPRYTCPK